MNIKQCAHKHNTQVKEEISRKKLKYFVLNENTIYDIQDTVKMVLRGKFIALNVYIRKGEIFKISNLNFCAMKNKKLNSNYIEENK